MDAIIGIIMLAAAFGFGFWLGLHRSDEQLRQATKRIENAIEIVKSKP